MTGGWYLKTALKSALLALLVVALLGLLKWQWGDKLTLFNLIDLWWAAFIGATFAFAVSRESLP